MSAHPSAESGPGFGPVLRAVRRAAGLTQEQLADLAGVGLSRLRDLESGRLPPCRRTLARLVDPLSRSVPERRRLLEAGLGAASQRIPIAPRAPDEDPERI